MKNWKKTFALIWSGQFMSIITSTTVNFAVILWITFETGSAGMLALASVAGLLPQVLLGPVAGVYIDRWNRKKTMILADCFIAFCTLILAVLFWLDVAEMWHIFLLLGLRSVGTAFHSPAMQAAVPMIAPAEQLPRVAGVNQMISSFGNIAGPALGALMIVNFEMEYILMLDIAGALFACTALLLVAIPEPERMQGTVRGVLREMKEGMAAVLRNRGLSWVFFFSMLVMLFLMPIAVMFPLMTTQHFGGGEYHVSLIEVVWGLGSLAGGAIMGAKVYNVNKVALINISYLACGLSFLIPGLLPPGAFAWFAALTAFGGITGALYMSSFTAVVQTTIEPDALGRVFAMYGSFTLAPSLIGLVGIGFFAEMLGVAASFVVCGIVIMAIGVAAFMFPSALRVDNREKRELIRLKSQRRE